MVPAFLSALILTACLESTPKEEAAAVDEEARSAVSAVTCGAAQIEKAAGALGGGVVTGTAKLAAAIPAANRRAGIDRPRSPARIDDRNTYIPAVAAQKKARAIADRLLRCFPSFEGRPRPEVFVMSGNTHEAFATARGDIFLSAKWFEGLDSANASADLKISEDALAFLIAHELAHVQLGHFDESQVTIDFDQLLATVQQVASLYRNIVAPGGTTSVTTASTKANKQIALMYRIDASISALRILGNGALLPYFWRENEKAADAIAVRVLALAGMQPNAGNDVLDLIGNAQRQALPEVNFHIDELIVSLQALALLEEENPIVARIKGAGIEAALLKMKRLFVDLAVSHPPVEERKQILEELYYGPVLADYPAILSIATAEIAPFGAKQQGLIGGGIRAASMHSCLLYHRNQFKRLNDSQVLASSTGNEFTMESLLDKLQSDEKGLEYLPPKGCKYDDGQPMAPNAMNVLGTSILQDIRDVRQKHKQDIPFQWYLFAEIRKAQGREDDFFQNIATGLKSSRTEEPLLLRAAGIAAANAEQIEAAKGWIDTYEKAFGSDWAFDMRTRLLWRQGNLPALISALAECQRLGNPVTARRCLSLAEEIQTSRPEILGKEGADSVLGKIKDSLGDVLDSFLDWFR